MIYLYGYLVIGVVVLAAVFAAHRLTRAGQPDSLQGVLDALNPDRAKLSFRVLNDFLAPAIVAVAVIVCWPFVIYMKARQIFENKSGDATEKEPEFAVKREHLLELLTVPDIEAREVVEDPLGAVPPRPFGHLNETWVRFAEGVGAEDEIWSFKAPWQGRWKGKEIRAGYVVVQGGTPASYFLTMRKKINDQL